MSAAPYSYLTASGPAAAPLAQLAWGLGGVAVAVVVIIGLLLAGAIWRRRAPAADPGNLEFASPPGTGMAWIYGGLAVSVPVLAACTVWVLIVLGQVLHPGHPAGVTIQVTAHQWWWQVRYQSPTGEDVFTTANEIHIPVGEPVRVELTSVDVIHSFWTPRLAGKMDAIPGVKNVTWMEADAPGVYRGECAEFCGLQHARMAFLVVAEPPYEFAQWRAGQLALAGAPAPGEPAAGAAIFSGRCAGCHTIAGTSFGGLVGPELSHLASRATLAAGLIPNDPAHLAAWIGDPQAIKPGALMPKVPLSTPERDALVTYLQTLK